MHRSAKAAIALAIAASLCGSGLPVLSLPDMPKDQSSDEFLRSMDPRFRLDPGAYYAPPLPPAKFLDAEQAEIARHSHPRVADLVEFADAEAIGETAVKSREGTVKPWTEEERRDVQAILNRLLEI